MSYFVYLVNGSRRLISLGHNETFLKACEDWGDSVECIGFVGQLQLTETDHNPKPYREFGFLIYRGKFV